MITAVRPTRPPILPLARLHGAGFAVACATVFSVNTVCARLAFESGADAPTSNAVRFTFTVLVLLLVAALRRKRPTLTRRQRLAAMALGVPFFVASSGYLGSIQYIPVSVAVLVLYTYPILVGLIAPLTEGERLGPLRLGALLTAFLGLALALGVQAHTQPDWRGLGLAFLAAACMSVMVTGSSRLMREADRGAINLYLMLSASALFLVTLILGGETHWPHTDKGWLAFGGLLVTFAAGQLALIAAIGRAGPVLTSAVMNLEPLVTIGLAVLLVGESLTLLQLVGAGLVVLAIFMMSRAGPPAPAPVAEP
jgi:drug/metabolite transporter (DMT)-like permease